MCYGELKIKGKIVDESQFGGRLLVCAFKDSPKRQKVVKYAKIILWFLQMFVIDNADLLSPKIFGITEISFKGKFEFYEKTFWHGRHTRRSRRISAR